MNHILNRMHEVMVEMQQIMTNEIVMNSPQMKQNLEDMQKNMGTLIMEMDGFLGNFEQVRKHQEGMMWHEMGWGGMWFGWLISIIALFLIIWVIVRFSVSAPYRRQPPASNEAPLDILKRRYAKGEINKDQFERIKKDL
jgi:putative membrane protein